MSDEDLEIEYENSKRAMQLRIERNQKARSGRRTKLRLQKVRAFLALVIAVAICYCVYRFATCHYWYFPSNIFDKTENNPRIKLEGNVVTSDYKIMNVLRQMELPRLPIYLINTRTIEKNIGKLEPVKKVYIRRLAFPARFVIRIEERVPVLTISPNENVPPIAFFTSCGKLISKDYMPLPENYKTYLVLSYGNIGEDYYNWDMTQVNTILNFAKEMERLSKEHVQYIDLRNPKDIYVKLDSALVRIGETDDTLYERIKNIGSILPLLPNLKDKKIKYVDLRWETNYLKIDNAGHHISPAPVN